MSQLQSHTDPLLEFTTEFGESSPALPDPTEVAEAPVVSVTPDAVATAADDRAALRGRVDQLEQALAESAEELRALRAEVATLVSLTGDIRKRPPRPFSVVPLPSKPTTPRTTRVVSAIAGIVLGVAIGLWFWRVTDSEPLLPSAPVAIASERSAPPPPPSSPAPAAPDPGPQPASRPPTPPAIVPAAVVTPVHKAPERPAPRRVEYVGTLTIDSEPGGDVFIDRKPAGRTPLRAEDLKAGSHLIWIEQDGYRRFTRVVQVPADRVTRLVADLEPAQR